MILRKIVIAVASALVLSLAAEIIKLIERKLEANDDERSKGKSKLKSKEAAASA